LLVAAASEGDAAAGVVVEAVAEAVLVEEVGVGGEVAVLLVLREGAGEVEAVIDSTANEITVAIILCNFTLEFTMTCLCCSATVVVRMRLLAL
jgi:hypothetical protein